MSPLIKSVVFISRLNAFLDGIVVGHKAMLKTISIAKFSVILEAITGREMMTIVQ